MKKVEVEIGGEYYANVSGNRVEIRIDAEKPRGGWDATNLATGKKIVIKTAQRLHGEVRTPTSCAKESAKVVMESATVASDPSPAVTAPKKPHNSKIVSPEAGAGEKRLSCVAAALKVLGESGEPMNAQELINAMEAKGYWVSPGGKTPHATLYSAILRDLAKGDESKFVKTERGKFTVRG